MECLSVDITHNSNQTRIPVSDSRNRLVKKLHCWLGEATFDIRMVINTLKEAIKCLANLKFGLRLTGYSGLEDYAYEFHELEYTVSKNKISVILGRLFFFHKRFLNKMFSVIINELFCHNILWTVKPLGACC